MKRNLGFKVSLFAASMSLATIGFAHNDGKHETKAAEAKVEVKTQKAANWMKSKDFHGAEVNFKGDLTKAEAFSAEFKFPKNYKATPHTHPNEVTYKAIKGAFWLGFGDKFDHAAAKEYTEGTAITVPANQAHFFWTKEVAEVEASGNGPFTTTYEKAFSHKKFNGKRHHAKNSKAEKKGEVKQDTEDKVENN